jgi:PPOX class probable F420-dependent enzyme
MQIDRATPFGARVIDRLSTETIVWLTTVGKDGTPHPRPVWFLWDGDTMLIYSQPQTAKLAHIARNPRVSLNFDGDGRGGNIVVITGAAAVDAAAPPTHRHAVYLDKYRADIQRIGMTPEQFAAAYSVALRITPEKLTGH